MDDEEEEVETVTETETFAFDIDIDDVSDPWILNDTESFMKELDEFAENINANVDQNTLNAMNKSIFSRFALISEGHPYFRIMFYLLMFKKIADDADSNRPGRIMGILGRIYNSARGGGSTGRTKEEYDDQKKMIEKFKEYVKAFDEMTSDPNQIIKKKNGLIDSITSSREESIRKAREFAESRKEMDENLSRSRTVRNELTRAIQIADERLLAVVKLYSSEQRAMDARLNRLWTHKVATGVAKTQAETETKLHEMDVATMEKILASRDISRKYNVGTSNKQMLEKRVLVQRTVIDNLDNQISDVRKERKGKGKKSVSTNTPVEEEDKELSKAQKRLIDSVIVPLTKLRGIESELLERRVAKDQLVAFKNTMLSDIELTCGEVRRKMDILRDALRGILEERALSDIETRHEHKHGASRPRGAGDATLMDRVNGEKKSVWCWTGGDIRSKILRVGNTYDRIVVVHCCGEHRNEVYKYFEECVIREIFHGEDEERFSWEVTLLLKRIGHSQLF